MTATDFRLIDGKYKYLFKLSFGYGYAMMLNMAQIVIDYYFSGNVQSFRVSLLSGLKEREYKFILRLHGNRINKCRSIQKEQGVIYLNGKSTILDDEIEIVWFNQTNIIGVAGNFGDEYHKAKIEMMLDTISSI